MALRYYFKSLVSHTVPGFSYTRHSPMTGSLQHLYAFPCQSSRYRSHGCGEEEDDGDDGSDCPSPHAFKRKLWQAISLIGAIPAIIALSILTFTTGHEEEELPEYIPYEYLYRLTKRWPWGDGTKPFFYNPEKNRPNLEGDGGDDGDGGDSGDGGDGGAGSFTGGANGPEKCVCDQR